MVLFQIPPCLAQLNESQTACFFTLRKEAAIMPRKPFTTGATKTGLYDHVPAKALAGAWADTQCLMLQGPVVNGRGIKAVSLLLQVYT